MFLPASTPFPVCKLTSINSSVYHTCPKELIISSDSPGRSQVRGLISLTRLPACPTSCCASGLCCAHGDKPFNHITYHLNISRLNIQSHYKSIYQSHENNISKFKASVFGKSSCSPLVSSCGGLD